MASKHGVIRAPHNYTSVYWTVVWVVASVQVLYRLPDGCWYSVLPPPSLHPCHSTPSTFSCCHLLSPLTCFPSHLLFLLIAVSLSQLLSVVSTFHLFPSLTLRVSRPISRFSSPSGLHFPPSTLIIAFLHSPPVSSTPSPCIYSAFRTHCLPRASTPHVSHPLFPSHPLPSFPPPLVALT